GGAARRRPPLSAARPPLPDHREQDRGGGDGDDRRRPPDEVIAGQCSFFFTASISPRRKSIWARNSSTCAESMRAGVVWRSFLRFAARPRQILVRSDAARLEILATI